jgi:hypothetical protein
LAHTPPTRGTHTCIIEGLSPKPGRTSSLIIQGDPPALPGWVRVQACSVQGGANSPQVNLLRPVANCNCVAARRGGEQRKANRVVRSESKLDSAALTGEPAHQRRSLYLCERESHDAEGLGDKAVMGGSGVVGDGRLWRNRTREARRPAWCKKEKGSQGTALRKERYKAAGSRLHAGVNRPQTRHHHASDAGRWHAVHDPTSVAPYRQG